MIGRSDNMDKQTLIKELRYSLPSKRMLDVVRCAVVKVNDELIVLKNRYDFQPMENLMIKYDEVHDMSHDYKEIQGRSVIFDVKLFGQRGQRAIQEYLIEEEFKYCQECGKLLDRENDEYHASFGTCNMYCYGKMVGVYV